MTDDVRLGAFQRVVDAIRTELQTVECEVSTGRAALAEISRQRRIVFVQLGGRLSPPGQKAYKPASAPTVIVRPQYTCELDVLARLTAEDDLALEQMWLDVLLATRSVLGFNSVAGVFLIDSQADGAALSSRDGPQLQQRFSWKVSLSTRQETGSASAYALDYGIGDVP